MSSLHQPKQPVNIEDSVRNDDGKRTACAHVIHCQGQEQKRQGNRTGPTVIEMVGKLNSDTKGDSQRRRAR